MNSSMSRFRLYVVLFALAMLLGRSPAASADPVHITSGYLTVGGSEHPDRLPGVLASISYDLFIGGFELRGGDPEGRRQNPFAPTLVIPSFLSRPGNQSEVVRAEPDTSFLHFLVTPSVDPTLFSMAGFLTIVEHPTGPQLFVGDVSGSGLATFRYVPGPLGGPLLVAFTYQFNDVAPTPEPGALLLLGTAAMAFWAGARRLA
jgi:hypothetical protein